MFESLRSGQALGWITDFADEAVLLPLALVVLGVLLSRRWWRGAAAWAGSIGTVLGAILVLKLAGHACGWRMVSPSGHTAAGAAIYGGVLLLLLPARWFRAGIGVAIAAGLAVVLGGTRLALHLHTPAETLIGAGFGVLGPVVFVGLAGAPPVRSFRGFLAGAVLVVVLLLHGRRLPAEVGIDHVARIFWPFALCVGRKDGLF